MQPRIHQGVLGLAGEVALDAQVAGVHRGSELYHVEWVAAGEGGGQLTSPGPRRRPCAETDRAWRAGRVSRDSARRPRGGAER